MYNNKRGLSAIVATVLIILLVIAGVALLWSPVRKLIISQSDDLEASCLMANPRITEACMGGAGNVDLLITISNGADAAIDGVQVNYGVDENTLTGNTIDNSAIGINQVRTITIPNVAGTTATRIAARIGEKTCGAGSITSNIGIC